MYLLRYARTTARCAHCGTQCGTTLCSRCAPPALPGVPRAHIACHHHPLEQFRCAHSVIPPHCCAVTSFRSAPCACSRAAEEVPRLLRQPDRAQGQRQPPPSHAALEGQAVVSCNAMESHLGSHDGPSGATATQCMYCKINKNKYILDMYPYTADMEGNLSCC